MSRPDPSDLDDLLRAALCAEANRISPQDRLAGIRARAAGEPAAVVDRGRGRLLSLLVAAAVVAMVVVGVRGGAQAPADPAAGTGLGPTPSAGMPPGRGTPAAPRGAALPVFALTRITEPGPDAAGTRQRWALQRWFVSSDLPSPAPARLAVRDAVRRALGLGVLSDPDRLPAFDMVTGDAEPTPELITITLSGGGRPLTGAADAEFARLSVQQLVWTAQAAYGHRVPVTFRLEDGGDLLLGRFPAAARYDRPDSDRILTDAAPVWIDQPGLGATLSADTAFTLTGLAAVPDNRLTWTITRAPTASTGTAASTTGPPPAAGSPASVPAGSDAPVLAGEAVADEAVRGGPPAQRRYTVVIPGLQPGQYRLTVALPSPAGGPALGVASVDLVVD